MPINQRALKKYVNECLFEHGADEESLNSMSQVTKDFLTVIKRQAADYLSYCAVNMQIGTAKMLVLGENTPAANIMAETILGIHDHLRRRASNASESYYGSQDLLLYKQN